MTGTRAADTVAQPAARGALAAETGTRFRPDVEGLRAVAVGLVLLYHAGVPIVRGGFVGVDVFFVISGFLITGMLVREVQRDSTVSLPRFYARRAKRLLPAAALVLVVTAALTWALVPITDRRTFGGDIVASALYVVNWRFGDRSVDYLAEDVGVSPVQHFWSLAVEEQFYIVWPLLLLAVAWFVRRTGRSVRATMGVGLAVIAVPSFAWSILMTAQNPAPAFFVTTTRLWELAIGAAVAIAMPSLTRLPRAVAVALGWAGLAAVVAAALLLTTSTAWPGYAALLPTLGTAAVIAAGTAAGKAGPVAVLGLRPMVWIGGLSYSLYLWHWPLIVLATARWGELSVLTGLAVVAFSFIPAWLAYTFVENPVRHARSMRGSRFALSVGANLTLVGVVVGMVLVHTTTTADAAAPAGQSAQGAAVLEDEPKDDPDGVPVDTVAWMTPEPLEAPEDHPEAYDDGCQVDAESGEPVACEYGDPDGDTTIALVGDSKALQWSTALDEIGADQGWRIVTYTKSACSYSAAAQVQDKAVYESCVQWGEAVHDALLDDPPDVVLTSQGRKSALKDPDDPTGGLSGEAMVDGLVERWKDLSDAGVQVVALADTPQPGMNVYECVAENPEQMTACAFDRDEAIDDSAADTLRAAADEVSGAEWIDLNDAICPAESCAPVIGNTLVYRQGSHLTASYVGSLTPRLESALKEIVG